ncbi:MAG: LamG domain-containing protein, partial [Candidatus Paceibacterota bacterium]
QHIAVTISGKTITHYLNGRENGSGALDTPRANNDQKPLYIGTRDDRFTQMSGLMDDVRVYNRALSAKEITGLANSSR